MEDILQVILDMDNKESLWEKNGKETLRAGLHTLILFGSITAIGYIHDCKYGHIAQERWERDSIATKQYNDSCYKAKQDSIYRITGTYEKIRKWKKLILRVVLLVQK